VLHAHPISSMILSPYYFLVESKNYEAPHAPVISSILGPNIIFNTLFSKP